MYTNIQFEICRSKFSIIEASLSPAQGLCFEQGWKSIHRGPFQPTRGHTLANMHITVLEIVKKESSDYRLEREKYFINKFNTYYKGLNRQK